MAVSPPHGALSCSSSPGTHFRGLGVLPHVPGEGMVPRVPEGRVLFLWMLLSAEEEAHPGTMKAAPTCPLIPVSSNSQGAPQPASALLSWMIRGLPNGMCVL